MAQEGSGTLDSVLISYSINNDRHLMNPEDEKACHRLCIDYVHFIDAPDFEKFAELFTKDGLLELPARRLRGRDEIFNILSQRPSSIITLHMCTSSRITARGPDEASGSTYAMIFRQDAGVDAPELPIPMTQPLSAGIYDDEFVRTTSGWRFRSRRMRAFFRKQ